MRAGDLNRRITIQRRGDAKGGWGGSPKPGADNWEEVGKAWASIKTLSGLGAIKADAEMSVVKASIRLRWRADLAAGMRVLHGGTVYDIKAVLPDTARREHVDLVCEVREG
ncbi:phage head closure protein [Acidovorax sp. NCPPB 4044]|uniref:phage head closure protein n=1 Tax=Acidovorax sp. NCPPB 4044 TaxID=2940490 RepID=UPI0023020FEF|nr:phage head closure protein [Acidovorax sp. NCPPB 4044]MDA8521983.1 phage head closure protein [Acidovorax sp. NCPPB 4044]